MIEINLLPIREEKRKADLRQFALLLGATLLGALVLVGAVHGKVLGDLSSARSELAATQVEVDKFKPQLAQVEKYRATKGAIEAKLAVIEELDLSRSGPVHVMDELSVHSPERLWITSIEASQGTLTVKGMSLDNELVALFMTSLNDSPYFTAVELQETEAKDVEGLRLNRFELTAQLVSPRRKPVEQESAGTIAVPAGTGR
jgi:type IV pilus assembly protein PilN